MKSHIKLATVFGVELGLHYSWLIIAGLIVFSLVGQFDATNPQWGWGVIWAAAIITGVLFFAALFAHELSHALVAKSRGIPIHQITLFMLGGMAQIEGEPQSAGAEFWMAIVGPITSAVIGAALLALVWALGYGFGAPPASPGAAILLWLGYINLALAAFNMIPGFPLDGGRVLRAIVWRVVHDADRSTIIAARVGQAVAFLFMAYGIFRMFGGAAIGGLWIAFIGWFLLQAAGASLVRARTSSMLSGLRARDLASTNCAVVPPEAGLDIVIGEFLRSRAACAAVVDNGLFIGMVAPDDVRDIPSQNWQRTLVKDVMRSAAEVHFISADAPASAALEMMARYNLNHLPILSDSRFAGIVSRASVVQSLNMHAGPRAA